MAYSFNKRNYRVTESKAQNKREKLLLALFIRFYSIKEK